MLPPLISYEHIVSIKMDDDMNGEFLGDLAIATNTTITLASAHVLCVHMFDVFSHGCDLA